MKCVICKERDANQRHHICYDPEMIVDTCVFCHLKMHKHGVGYGKGECPPPNLDDADVPVEAEPIGSRFTQLIPYEKLSDTEKQRVSNLEKPDEKTFYVTNQGEILNWIICPNNCREPVGPFWNLYHSPQQDVYFLICPDCGYDTKIERVG